VASFVVYQSSERRGIEIHHNSCNFNAKNSVHLILDRLSIGIFGILKAVVYYIGTVVYYIG